MKSYNQYCGLAKALDLVGDRWSLLIVREILARGSCRYVDVKNGLPGIATNLLANRLRELEKCGIIRRVDAGPPVSTHLFELTERGRGLEAVIEQLGRWAAPAMVQPAERDTFQSHWMTVPLRFYLRDRKPEDPPATIELRVGDEPLTIDLADGDVRIASRAAANPSLIIEGPPQVVMRLLRRQLPLDDARRRGTRLSGDLSLLARIEGV
ncbi:MAG: winged helix-turn-helix transcriptional regulator [Pseudomonadota bacterium]